MAVWSRHDRSRQPSASCWPLWSSDDDGSQITRHATHGTRPSGRTRLDDDNSVSARITSRAQRRQDSPGGERERFPKDRSSLGDRTTVGVRPGNDKNDPLYPRVALLAKQWPDLCLSVSEPADEFVGDANRWPGKNEVEGPQIGRWSDRHFECDRPAAGRHDLAISVHHLELARVAEPSGTGVQLKAQAQTDRSGVRREILDGDAPRGVALDPPDGRWRPPQCSADIRLPKSRGDPCFTKVGALLGHQSASDEPRLIHASQTVCHGPIIRPAALRPGYSRLCPHPVITPWSPRGYNGQDRPPAALCMAVWSGHDRGGQVSALPWPL